MKKAFISVLFVIVGCFAGVNALAQAPGYLGRRNIVHADLYFAPAMPRRYNNPYSASGNGGFYFNSSQALGIERVVSRRHVLGLDGEYIAAGFEDNRYSQSGYTRLRALGLGFHLRAFPFLRKGWIAPLGPYVGFAVKVFSVSETFLQNGRHGGLRGHGQHFAESLAMIFGYSGCIKGRFLLDTGARIAITDLIKGNTYDRPSLVMLTTDLFKLHIGLGVLLGK